MSEILQNIFLGIIFIVSISVHEYAHVAAAHALWDPTGKMLGRLTRNPFVHIDPIGFVLIFLIGFGWWRLAPYNPNYFKKPYRDELLVALAGPASNIVLGIIGIIIMLLYMKFSSARLVSQDLVVSFWSMFCGVNFALAAFNMIPLPPLDGYRLIKVANHSRGAWLEAHMMWISIAFLLLVVFGPFKWVLNTYISSVAEFLYHLFLVPIGMLIWS